MGSLILIKLEHTHLTHTMKFFLAACLVAAAFAAPVADNFIDPDCIENALVVEEPLADINAEFGLAEPSIVVNFGSNEPSDEECEDDIEPTPAPVEEECVDEPIVETTEAECVSDIAETEPAPEPTAAECEESLPTTEAPAGDECEEGEGADAAPILNMKIEPAYVLNDVTLGEENQFPVVEECEE